jgi:hypothetical protein
MQGQPQGQAPAPVPPADQVPPTGQEPPHQG